MTNPTRTVQQVLDWPGWRFASPPLLALLLGAVAWLRIPAAARGTMWAEDGAIFLTRAANPDQLTDWVFTAYDGYTHALSQSIALAVWNLVPLEYAAVAFTASTCLVAGIVGGAIFAITKRWRLNLVGRLLMASITVLVPGLTSEVLGNLANVHWFLLWLTPFVLLIRPRTWMGAVGLGLALFVIGTSEVQSFAFAPLLLWRIRDRRRWVLALGVLAAGIFQSAAILAGSRERGTTPSLAAVLDGYFLQVPLAGLLGTTDSASAAVGYTGWIIAYVAVVPFAACAVWLAWRSPHRLSLIALFASASIVLWCVGFAVNYNSSFDYADMSQSQLIGGVSSLRYAVVPTMFLFGTVALAVGSERPRGPGRLSAARLLVSVMTLSILIVAFHVHVAPARASGPNWRSSIATLTQVCTGDENSVIVPIAPQGWTAELPCLAQAS